MDDGEMIVDDKMLEEMRQIVIVWGGSFDISYDTTGPWMEVGPGKTRAGIIQMGYGKIYNRMWELVKK